MLTRRRKLGEGRVTGEFSTRDRKLYAGLYFRHLKGFKSMHSIK